MPDLLVHFLARHTRRRIPDITRRGHRGMGVETVEMHVRQWRDDHGFGDRWDVAIRELLEARGDDAIVAAVCGWRFAAGVAGLVVEDQVWFLL